MLSANVSFSYGDNRYNDDIQEENYRFLSNVNEDIWELKNFLSYSKTVKSQKFSLVMKDNYTTEQRPLYGKRRPWPALLL